MMGYNTKKDTVDDFNLTAACLWNPMVCAPHKVLRQRYQPRYHVNEQLRRLHR